MAFTKEKAIELGCSFETDTPTQEEIDAKVESRLTELTGENSKLKNTISKVNSENADYKRKAQEKLSEEEKTNLRIKELEESNAKWEKQFAKSNKVADYVSIGYSKELAEKIADAELEGKPTASFHQEFIKAKEESIRKEIMAGNPQPKVNDPKAKTLTEEDYKKLSYSQKLELKEKNPDLFDKFHK